MSLQEAENQAFEKLIEIHGLHGLEAKLQRLESCRHFYRRYPYDAWSTRVGMDYVDLVMPGNPLEEIIAQEAHDELLSGLTDRERQVAVWAEEGYKPRDMAGMRGVTTSNADRWIKHSVKTKMQLGTETDITS